MHFDPDQFSSSALEVLQVLHFPTGGDFDGQAGGFAPNAQVVAPSEGALSQARALLACSSEDEISNAVSKYATQFRSLEDAEQFVWEVTFVREYLRVLTETAETMQAMAWSWTETSEDFHVMKPFVTRQAFALNGGRALSRELGDSLNVLGSLVDDINHDTSNFGAAIGVSLALLETAVERRDSQEITDQVYSDRLGKSFDAIRGSLIVPLLSLKTHYHFYTGAEDLESFDAQVLRQAMMKVAYRFNCGFECGEVFVKSEDDDRMLRLVVEPETEGKLTVHFPSICFSITQLLKNSIKASGKNSGDIEVRVAWDEADRATIISVSDLGVGFSFDELRAAFGAEARARIEEGSDVRLVDHILCSQELRGHVTEVLLNHFLGQRGRSFQGGTGLGLSMVRRLIEANSGYLDLRSNDGEGATVSFVFPDHGEDQARPDEVSHRLGRFNTASDRIVPPPGSAHKVKSAAA